MKCDAKLQINLQEGYRIYDQKSYQFSGVYPKYIKNCTKELKKKKY